jgi:hypothetical protein
MSERANDWLQNLKVGDEPMECPWDFSDVKAVDAGEPDLVPNVPTPEGRALGVELARLTEQARPEFERLFPNVKPMCHDCAFRAGTGPNGCPETLMDALKCVIEVFPMFYCHHGAKDAGETRLYRVSDFAVRERKERASHLG